MHKSKERQRCHYTKSQRNWKTTAKSPSRTFNRHFPGRWSLIWTQQTSCQLQQPLHRAANQETAQERMPIRQKTNPGGENSKREPINQRDGQTALCHVPVLKASTSCFPAGYPWAAEPSKALGAEFPPEPGFSWPAWTKDWGSQQGGQDLLMTQNCHTYPTAIPALSCPQMLTETKRNKGRRALLFWGGFILL